MIPEESVLLMRYLRALCPSQKQDEYTPDAWYNVLKRWSLQECQDAMDAIVGTGAKWIDVGDVVTEIKRVRARRLANSDIATQPPQPVDPIAYRNGMRQILHHLANSDGQPPPFKAIEGNRRQAGPPQAAKDIRATWEAEQAAKREAEKAAREERLAASVAERDARQRATEASAAMLLLTDEAALAAYKQARDELGSDASRDQIMIRAAQLADHTKTRPVGKPAEAAKDSRSRGCRHGCQYGAHEKPCPDAGPEPTTPPPRSPSST